MVQRRKCHILCAILKWILLIFGLNNDRKNQSSLAIFKKLDFTILCAKYYLYINKLAPKDLSLDEFKTKISWRYDLEKPLPSIG